MSAISKIVMRKFYRRADGHPEKLPWHQDTPPKVLVDAVAARGGEGRALDLGCGAGVFSVWLAEQGMEVTGIDLFPEAIAMARQRAAARNVRLDLVEGDLFDYEPLSPFQLIFDSGCLHSLIGGRVGDYRRKILSWLDRDGDYVLGHWGKRHPFDWRPIGPRRRSQRSIKKIFNPELHLEESEIDEFEAPFPFGPMVRGIGYWFRR